MRVPKKGKRFHIWKCHVTLTRTKAVTFISQNHCSTFILKNQLASFSYQHSISFTHGLQHYKALDKLACTDYVDFGKNQDRFGRFSWSKNYSNYLDIKLKVFKREDKNAKFALRQNFSMGEADFNQFIRQRNLSVVAADNFLREENLPPILQSTQCKSWNCGLLTLYSSYCSQG